jgi:hypothetical protein
VLDAAVERYVSSAPAQDELLGALPLPDLASELTVLARLMLARLDREERISRVLEKEGSRMPDLVERFRTGLSDPGYQLAAAYLRGRGFEGDADAAAAVLLGSLVNVRRSQWTLLEPPNGVDDDRFVAAWVEISIAALGGVRDT